MLDKPEFLTGEVKSFEEWMKQWFISDWLKGNAFYTQPFDPEMIEKYFEGWVISETYKGCSVENVNYSAFNYSNVVEIEPIEGHKRFRGYVIHFTDYESGELFYSCSYHPGDDSPHTVMNVKPKTLQHFISDCERAGIKLQWR
jgi:hypothetical protein